MVQIYYTGNFSYEEEKGLKTYISERNKQRSIPEYRIAHIGINTINNKDAEALIELLSKLFCQDIRRRTNNNVLVGNIFEVVIHSQRSLHGHIALQTDDIELAVTDFESKGITFREGTIRRDKSGKICFIYLEQEFGGFAFHLTR